MTSGSEHHCHGSTLVKRSDDFGTSPDLPTRHDTPGIHSQADESGTSGSVRTFGQPVSLL